MTYKFHGRGYILVPGTGRSKVQWPTSWQNVGTRFTASCRYCGKKFKGVTTFRMNYQCRAPGGKVVGRITPVVLSKNLGVGPDQKYWDFVCKDCEPARRADWCKQQGIRDRIGERGGKK